MRGSRAYAMIAAAVAAVLVASGALLTGGPPSTTAPAAAPGAPVGRSPSAGLPLGNAAPPTNATAGTGNGTPPPGNTTPPANGTPSNLTMTLTVRSSTVLLGEAVGYVVTIQDVGSANATVPFMGCNPWLVVWNESRDAVYDQAAGMCPMIVTTFTLAPGQSRSFNTTWSQLTTAGQPVPAGAYLLTEYWSATRGDPLDASVAIVIAAP